MRAVLFLSLVLVACGGKIDTGDDAGNGGVDASADASKDSTPTSDAIVPPPPTCSPITGGTSVSSDGSCTTTATWTCGATKYTVDCSCPSAQCTCGQETSNGGVGHLVNAPSLCPGCSSNLPALCGFPTN